MLNIATLVNWGKAKSRELIEPKVQTWSTIQKARVRPLNHSLSGNRVKDDYEQASRCWFPSEVETDKQANNKTWMTLQKVMSFANDEYAERQTSPSKVHQNK